MIKCEDSRTYREIEDLLSKERLEPYLLISNNKYEVLELYNININLSQSLYSVLSYFEILLRNSCNNKLKKEVNSDWYFDNDLLSGNNAEKGEETIKKIQDAVENIKKRKREKGIANYIITNGDITANLNFGFWSNLFNANYEHKIWRPYLQHIFKDFNRKELCRQFEAVRVLRNRIFHYEPIIFDNRLEKRYNTIIGLITYIAKDNICSYIESFNDFKKVYEEYKKTRAVL
jgi:hypothetical protein